LWSLSYPTFSTPRPFLDLVADGRRRGVGQQPLFSIQPFFSEPPHGRPSMSAGKVPGAEYSLAVLEAAGVSAPDRRVTLMHPEHARRLPTGAVGPPPQRKGYPGPRWTMIRKPSSGHTDSHRQLFLNI